MSPRLLVGLVASGLAATSGEARAEGVSEAPSLEIEVQDRVPLAFLLVSPSGAAAQVRSSVIIDLVSEIFEAHTDFNVSNFDPESVIECDGRLPCMVRAVRTDYDRARLATGDGVASFSEHQARVEARGLRVPKALLVLSSVAFGDEDRLIPQWIDTDEALAILHEADRSRPGWERDVEARVREYAVPVELPSASVTSESDARAFLEALVTERLREELERSEHWAPFGRIVLEAAPEGAALRLDGRTVGTTRAGRVVLRGVRPGPHTVELERAGSEPWSTELELPRSGEIALRPALQDAGTHPGRTALLWGGLGVGAAGIAVGAWALAAQADDTVTYCASPCSDRFLALGEDTSTTPEVGARSGGVLAAPLGYSLALTGATWALGSALLGDDEDFPWWSAIGGLVLGGTAYAVSAALDPGPPR